MKGITTLVIICMLSSSLANEDFDIYANRDLVIQQPSKLEKYTNIITDEILMGELGVPEPFNKILFAAVVWFVLYVPSKILYAVLHMCYGQGQTNTTIVQKEDQRMSILQQQVQQLGQQISMLKQKSTAPNIDLTPIQNVLSCQKTNNIGQLQQNISSLDEKLNFIYQQVLDSEVKCNQLIAKINSKPKIVKKQVTPQAPLAQPVVQPPPIERPTTIVPPIPVPAPTANREESKTPRQERKSSKSPFRKGITPGKSPMGGNRKFDLKSPMGGKKQFDLQGQSGASATTPEDEYGEGEYYYDEEEYGEEEQTNDV